LFYICQHLERYISNFNDPSAWERLSSDALSIDMASTGLLDNPGNSRPVDTTERLSDGSRLGDPASLLRATIERTDVATDTYLYRLALAKLNATG
jgi:hypothetical protein